MRVRNATSDDFEAVLALRRALWPDHDPTNLAREIRSFLDDDAYVFLVAEDDAGALRGLAEASVRPHCNGCTMYPVGYLEAWFVEDGLRRTGLGRRLVAAAEAWARQRGCSEMGSDCHLDNDASRAAHARLGYKEHNHLVHFIRSIRSQDNHHR